MFCKKNHQAMDVLQSLESFCKNKSDKEQSKLCENKIKEFNEKYKTTFTFDNIFNIENHGKLLDILFELINDHSNSIENTFKLDCLSMIRLLSRDKNLILSIKNLDDCLGYFTNLLNSKKADETDNVQGNLLCKIEALKCLCNWLYHSGDVRRFFINMKFTQDIVSGIVNSNYKLGDHLFYQIRIMFLMSALESEERVNMINCDAVIVLVKVLEEVNSVTTEP